VYQSNEKLYEKILPLLGFQKVKNKFIEDYILYSYEKMYRKYLKERSMIPEKQLFEVSYSDFVSSPIEYTKKIYAHLNLGDFEKARPFLNEEVQSVKNYQNNLYSGMSEKTKSQIKEKWAFFFDAFGYDKNK
jgi:hypothetical protein